MKKALKFLCVIAMVFSATFAAAQGRYDKGDVLLNPGIGLGYTYFGGGLPLLLSADFAVNDVITVGPFLGYTSYGGYRFSGSNYRYTSFDLGVRGSYHFSELFEIRNEKVDIYGGANLGYSITGSNFDYGTFDDPYPNRVIFGLHAGTRYFFSEKVAGFGELGFGLATLAIGLTFKL
jgi:hypothetical protein